jgi:hypothetical protein
LVVIAPRGLQRTGPVAGLDAGVTSDDDRADTAWLRYRPVAHPAANATTKPAITISFVTITRGSL